MRRIRVGDIVCAHLDASYRGKVLEILTEKSSEWMMGGTAGVIIYCVIQFKNGKTVKTKMSELHVVDE